jgi:hypothetical protein
VWWAGEITRPHGTCIVRRHPPAEVKLRADRHKLSMSGYQGSGIASELPVIRPQPQKGQPGFQLPTTGLLARTVSEYAVIQPESSRFRRFDISAMTTLQPTGLLPAA